MYKIKLRMETGYVLKRQLSDKIMTNVTRQPLK